MESKPVNSFPKLEVWLNPGSTKNNLIIQNHQYRTALN